LLVQGNGKLGTAIHSWSIPAIGTCPGSTELCRRLCYAGLGHFLLPAVKERLDWNYNQSLRDDFSERMVQEIRRKGVIVLRIHVSGDFFSAEYAGKWLDIMRQCSKVRFYWYSRSWRVPAIAPMLEDMAALRCCYAWYSIDAETGVPLRLPAGVRLAYMQVSEDDRPELANLVFRVRRLRKGKRIGLPMICPAETPQGKERSTTCGSCQHCFR
jgi:hypothetical protein